ncbi:MAG: polysaccharide deacetylase family protein [Clostridia bacterium]|nr:polysaccharide deacetylase family protein [Clostridia bacterium]MBQ3939297.1 polysaccharide deacetylase family protein [Clostridia bacterium]MBQ5487340.1 polysaccharide deacetylase family protein [Clostridia bacterium]
MKKILALILALVFLASAAACNSNKPAGPGEVDIIDVRPVATPTPVVTEVPATPEPTPEPTPDPNAKRGCFYGENTGTDKTYTGLEPLPLSDFGNPPMENTQNLSTERIEHGCGNAVNEQPNISSVYYQDLFDDNGLNAICYDRHSDEKVLYLTFDCGYNNGTMDQILDTLRDKNVPGTFFTTLPELRTNAEAMARVITDGHILGNHSCTHPDFSTLTRQQMYDEVKGYDDYLRTHFGYSSLYFRFPMGKHSIDSTTFLNEMGYTCVFWSIAYNDWNLNDQKGADYAFETVVSRLHPGAVILLHSISPDNANALGRIIDAARSMGYEFRSLADYNR